MSFLYYRTVTVDHTQCGSSDSSAFPVLVRSLYGTVNVTTTAVTWVSGDQFNSGMTSLSIGGTTYTFTYLTATTGTIGISAGTLTGAIYSNTPWLKTAANGGRIQNTTTSNSITVPADLIFTSDLGLTTKLNWEIEYYDGTNGVIVAWVQETVSHSTNTVFYLGYDDSSTTTFQGNVNGTWDSNFKGVWHLPNGTSLTANDSTSNGNNAGTINASATAGVIDGAASFNGSSQNIQVPQSSSLNLTNGTPLTIETWANITALTGSYQELVRKGSPWYLVINDSNKLGLAINNDYPNTGISSITTGQHHLVATYDGNTTINIYVDGVSTATRSNASALVVDTTDLYFGSTEPTPGQFFGGKLDEIRISNFVRPADWILTEYNNGNTPGTFITLGAETSAGAGVNPFNQIMMMGAGR